MSQAQVEVAQNVAKECKGINSPSVCVRVCVRVRVCSKHFFSMCVCLSV